MKSQFRINIRLDFWTIGIGFILSVIGILFIYSSSSHLADHSKYLKQIINLSISLIAYIVVANLNYQRFAGKSILIYLIGFGLLLVTLFLGSHVNNSKSWIKLGFFSVQLSEFSKLTFILFFSVFLSNHQNQVKKLSFLMISFLLLIPYLFLIILQPDIGTAVIFLFIFFIMLFVGGGSAAFLGMIFGIGAIGVLIPFGSYYLTHVAQVNNFFSRFLERSSYLVLAGIFCLAIAGFLYLIHKFFWFSKSFFYSALILITLGFGFFSTNLVRHLLKDYHYKRFLIFVDPDLDPMGKGYNIKQSLISIGSGKFTGQGFTKGKQNQGNFLPAKDTDFIISLIGEEWGFLGITIVLLLYLFLIYRCLYIAYSARDYVGALIALGITSMLAGHLMINIFSATGLFPVIGVPLPFISYGGSSLLTNYIGLGILLNIKMRRFSYN